MLKRTAFIMKKGSFNIANNRLEGLTGEELEAKTAQLSCAQGNVFGIEGPVGPYAGILDLFKIGIGPSSSHTNGPMNIANSFVSRPKVKSFIKSRVNAIASEGSELQNSEDHPDSGGGRIVIELFGSLALTGIGHGTDNAVLYGLRGKSCEKAIDVEIPVYRKLIDNKRCLHLAEALWINYDIDKDLIFQREISWDAHPNGMSICLYDVEGLVVEKDDFLSIGGGFFVTMAEFETGENGTKPNKKHPYCFQSWSELIKMTKEFDITIPELMFRNEIAEGYTRDQVYEKIDRIIAIMFNAINKGVSTSGPLPLRGFRRLAEDQYLELKANRCSGGHIGPSDPLRCLDYVAIYARAVNEENACGRQVVTAPTNGACGTIPAVMAYYWNFIEGSNVQGLREFIAVAAAVGSVIKRNASISGAEAGCQAEVGSAIAMAAAGLNYVSGGTPEEVGMSAEIGIEHSLGLTCDPIGGVVVAPCIERNAVGSTKAIMCARLAFLAGDKNHITLDSVIDTMFRTGLDLQAKYRETSLGGLALLGHGEDKEVFQSVMTPVAPTSSPCGGCNTEIKAFGCADSILESDTSPVTDISDEPTTLTTLIQDAIIHCEDCLKKDDDRIKVRDFLKRERGIPIAVSCSLIQGFGM